MDLGLESKENDSFDDFSIFDDILQNTQVNDTPKACYSSWAKSLDVTLTENANIPQNFDDLKPSRINYVLGRFASEAVDKRGELYSSFTIYLMISSLNRILKNKSSVDGMEIDVMKNPSFKRFRQALKGIIKQRQTTGATNKMHKVDIFSDSDYEKLWAVMGDKDPKMLSATIIFLTIRTFGLRSPDELYRFNMNKLIIEDKAEDWISVTYVENSNKNRQNGLKNGQQGNKAVTHKEQKCDTRGFMYWLEVYLNHCPDSVRNGDVFWLHPLSNWKENKIWYSKRKRIGITFFGTLIKSLFEQSGVEGDYSLRPIQGSMVNDLTQKDFDSSQKGVFKNWIYKISGIFLIIIFSYILFYLFENDIIIMYGFN